MEYKIVKIAVILNEFKKEEAEKTLNSITSNSYKNFQPIFFIKDGVKIDDDYNNIDKYYFQEEKEIYEIAQKNIKTDYIVFIKCGDTYTDNFCKYVEARIEKEDYIISFNNGEKKYYRYNNKQKGIIKIEEKPEDINIHLYGNVIKKEIFDQINIKEISYKYDLDVNIITKIMMIVGETFKIVNVSFNPNEIYDDIINDKLEYYNLDWYFEIFDNIENIIKFSKDRFNDIIKYAQYIIMYMIKLRIEVNVNVKNKHIINDEKYTIFCKKIGEVLEKLDDTIIMNAKGNKNVNYYMLKIKYNRNSIDEFREYAKEIYITLNKNKVMTASSVKLKVILMDIIDNKLVIYGLYPFPINDDMKIVAVSNNTTHIAQRIPLYSKYKSFNQTLYQSYAFKLEIDINVDKKQIIIPYLMSKNSKVKLRINFNKPMAKLNNNQFSYWINGEYIINYKNEKILIMKNSKSRHLKREFMYLKNLYKDKETRKCVYLRLLYWLTKPMFRRTIWIFVDKIYKGGDNGEYLYRYSLQQKDNIKKYYVLQEKCLDAQRFKKEKIKFIKYGSIHQRLLFLNSDIAFLTHNNAVSSFSFGKEEEEYFRDLYNYKSICIQHGLTVQYMPHLTNRLNDNLKLYFLASDVEKDNVLEEEYMYANNQEVIKVTGSPRYDGLKDKNNRIILITPSWRNYLAIPSNQKGEKRGYNNNFKESDYFKIYNKLINDKRLIDKAKEKNYKIVYLLHPVTSSQIDDYDKNDYVELVAATDNLNYEKILTESSLMITDYSGVQFDFAYMYKPIVYFHPKELPPSYEEGAYKYETMALGEIVDNSEKLIDTICEYMDNECKIKEKYKNRIDKFFKYHDYHNCERVYNEVMNKFYKK